MKWLLRIFTGLVVLVVGAVALLFLLPAEKIASLVTQQFEAATGRVMTLEGDVRPTLWPELGVNVGAVSIANASWSTGGPMLQAERLSVGVDMLALIGGNIHIKRVEIVAPKILLEVARDGRANWDMASRDSGGASDGAASGRSGAIPEFSMQRAQISDAVVTYVDHGSASRTELRDIDATIRVPDSQGAAELQMTAAMNGQSFALDATIAAFAHFLNSAAPVTADLDIGRSNIKFKGNAGAQPLQAGGRVDADLKDMAGVFALFGLTAPDVPQGLGRNVSISGDMTLTDAGRVTLRGGTIKLDDNVLTGAMDFTLTDRPRVVAKLSAGALDFSALTGGGPADAGSAAAGWSQDRIDVSALQSVDADIALTAESVDLGLAKLGRTRTVTTLDKGRSVTEIRELAAYGGAMAGSVVVNSRGGLSARANLTGDGVALQPLLQELAGFDRLIASGDVAVNLLMVGDDMHTLMNSLSGDGKASLGQGELRGLDLAGMLRNLDPSFVGEGAKTIFESVSGSFTVTDGVLRNKDLRLTAPLLTADGNGTLGIGAQDINFRVVPALLPGQGNGGLKVPLKITGPWADPKFQLDLEALAEQELADEVEEVKAKAEEVVIDKLKEELGVEVETLENVEDVLKDELENRVRDGLLDLLKGK